jgi:predicted amidohydrolase YtcJ
VRTLYRASRILTFSLPPEGAWLLVDDRHVERVGTGDPPTADRIVELPGTTIIPGIVDTHVHLTGTGMSMAHPEIARARSSAEVLDALERIAGQRSEPTLVHGFDESTWPDPRLPPAAALDDVADAPLIVVRVDGHLSLVNSAAMRAAHVDDADGVERTTEGAVTGVLTREANQAVKRWFSRQLPDRAIQEYQLDAAALAASRGVTSVHEMSMPAERGLRDLEVLLGHHDRLPVDVVTYVATTDVAQAIDLGLPAIGGDLPVDGSIGAHTAALHEDYADRNEERGVLYFDNDELLAFFHAAHAAGLQVGVHAIGDRAIEQVLMTWERVYNALDSRERRHFRARRHRVEHFEMAGHVHLERAAILGLTVSIQPAFDLAWGSPGDLYDTRLGWRRASGMNPFRSCLERGIELGLGSDSPITALDPMAAVTALESHHAPDQRLSRSQAFHLATYGGAKLAHQEEKKGALEPGMRADLAAYDVDPTTEPDPTDVRPVLTVSNGREVHAS